jgi:hypothetical protein
MINKKEYKKIKHDLKRASKLIPFIRDEEDSKKRNTLAGLLIDELDRLTEDLDEVFEAYKEGGNNSLRQ